jgi:hypothetical protein
MAAIATAKQAAMKGRIRSLQLLVTLPYGFDKHCITIGDDCCRDVELPISIARRFGRKGKCLGFDIDKDPPE